MRSDQILENEIIGMMSGIPTEETQNKYGEAARGIEIGKIEKTENFTRIPFSEVPEGKIIREGEFAYEMVRKQTKKEETSGMLYFINLFQVFYFKFFYFKCLFGFLKLGFSHSSVPPT